MEDADSLRRKSMELAGESDMDGAIKLLKNVGKIYKKNRDYEGLVDVCNEISQYYEVLGDYAQVDNYHNVASKYQSLIARKKNDDNRATDQKRDTIVAELKRKINLAKKYKGDGNYRMLFVICKEIAKAYRILGEEQLALKYEKASHHYRYKADGTYSGKDKINSVDPVYTTCPYCKTPLFSSSLVCKNCDTILHDQQSTTPPDKGHIKQFQNIAFSNDMNEWHTVDIKLFKGSIWIEFKDKWLRFDSSDFVVIDRVRPKGYTSMVMIAEYKGKKFYFTDEPSVIENLYSNLISISKTTSSEASGVVFDDNKRLVMRELWKGTRNVGDIKFNIGIDYDEIEQIVTEFQVAGLITPSKLFTTRGKSVALVEVFR